MGGTCQNPKCRKYDKILSFYRGWLICYECVWIKEQEVKETELLKSEDKTRNMIHHQEAVRIFPLIIEKSREIVDELDRIISSAPSYASGDMKKRASWDSENSRVEFRIISDLNDPEILSAIAE